MLTTSEIAELLGLSARNLSAWLSRNARRFRLPVAIRGGTFTLAAGDLPRLVAALERRGLIRTADSSAGAAKRAAGGVAELERSRDMVRRARELAAREELPLSAALERVAELDAQAAAERAEAEREKLDPPPAETFPACAGVLLRLGAAPDMPAALGQAALRWPGLYRAHVKQAASAPQGPPMNPAKSPRLADAG